MNKLKVIDNKDLVRDPYSKAIMNTNLLALNEHRKKREFAKRAYQNSQKINQLELDINNMNKDITEIKNILTALINKLT